MKSAYNSKVYGKFLNPKVIFDDIASLKLQHSKTLITNEEAITMVVEKLPYKFQGIVSTEIKRKKSGKIKQAQNNWRPRNVNQSDRHESLHA